MKNYSIWKDDINIKEYNKLDKEIKTDILIIGGGITGVSTLYHLRNSGLKVTLVEQNRIGMGVTSNTTGKITYLQDRLYNELFCNFGVEVASLYLKSQMEATNIILDIIKDNKIKCDLLKTNSYVYTNKKSEIDKVIYLKKFLEDNNVEVFEKKLNIVKNKYCIGVSDTYLFHPLKFIEGVMKKCDYADVYEDTSIRKIEKNSSKYVCSTGDNIIEAKWVVIASHYPYFNLPFLFPIKGNLEKSYVSASKKSISSVSLISYYKPVVSIRSYKDYMIYLSEVSNVSNNINDSEKFDKLLKKLSKYEVNPEYLWSNIDIMSNDSLPYIGEIEHNMYIGTGYNTWGMTNGVLAGKVISDLIQGINNKYKDLFNPKRINMKMFSMVIIDSYYNAVGYVKGMFFKDDNIKYDKFNNKEIAIYVDDNGEHKVYTKCPHMGCKLVFNNKEKTWDCPCHASRFDIDGKVINGPSNYNISVK